MEPPKPEPGDWIRFYRDGALAIGIVQYVRTAASWSDGKWRCETDRGPADDDEILELRRRDGATWIRE
jgi:hypothetical protein